MTKNTQSQDFQNSRKPAAVGMEHFPTHPERITSETTFAEVHKAMEYLAWLDSGEGMDAEESAWCNNFRCLAQDFYQGSNRNRLAMQVEYLEASEGERNLWRDGYAAAYGDDEHCKATGNWTWREWRKHTVEPHLHREDLLAATIQDLDAELDAVKREKANLMEAVKDLQKALDKANNATEFEKGAKERTQKNLETVGGSLTQALKENQDLADQVERLVAQNGALALKVLQARGEA